MCTCCFVKSSSSQRAPNLPLLLDLSRINSNPSRTYLSCRCHQRPAFLPSECSTIPIPLFTVSSSAPSQCLCGLYHIQRSQHDYRFPQINSNSKEVAGCHRREKAQAVSPGRNLDPVIPVPISIKHTSL